VHPVRENLPFSIAFTFSKVCVLNEHKNGLTDGLPLETLA
jgi:hypothetical protein